jgi:PAS domain-containing protein
MGRGGAEHQGAQRRRNPWPAFLACLPPKVVARGWPQHEVDVARLEGRFEDEAWRVRKDGRLFWANVIMTALYDDTGTRCGFAKITRDSTQRNRLESLEQTARRMTEFLAMLSHELRDPLASIPNAIGVMQTRTLDDPHPDWVTNLLINAMKYARGWPHSCGGPAGSRAGADQQSWSSMTTTMSPTARPCWWRTGATKR